MDKFIEVLNMCSVQAPGLDAKLNEHFRVHRLLSADIPPEARSSRALIPGAVGASAQLMAQLSKLEIVSTVGVGYNHVDIAYATEHGIVITNTPDVLSDDVADLAIALIVMTSRKLSMGDRLVRAGGWKTKDPIFSTSITGKRVGILGLGRIGMAIAKRATAMKMPVSYHNRHPTAAPYRYMESPVSLAAESDFLVVAASAQASSQHIIDRAVLKALGPTGILINVARGSLVDEDALVSMLRSGEIGGAGLDVFEHEPAVPASLLNLENVVLTPHIGSGTVESRAAMANLAVENLVAHFCGRPLPSEVPESRTARNR
jgi:hydroxypyruvate reductase